MKSFIRKCTNAEKINIRLFGTEESSTADSDENTKQVLVEFLEDKLDNAIAENLEFKSVHRIGKFSNSQGISRQIIARFLRYSDSEHVMSSAKKLKRTDRAFRQIYQRN